MGNGFENELASMNASWKTKKKEQPGLPEGIYTMRLVAASLQKSQSSGKLMIHREHLVIDGPMKGEPAHDYLHLETDNGPYWVSQWVEQMGFQSPDDLNELPEVLDAITQSAPTYNAQVKISGDFRNIRIKEVLTTDGAGAADEVEKEAAAPAAKTKTGAKPTAKKATPAAAPAFSAGDAVQFSDDQSNVMVGTVSEVAGDMAKVDVDGTEWEVPVAVLEPAEESATADPNQEALTNFLQAQGVEAAGTTMAELVAQANEYEWDEAQLTPDEVALLKELGIEYKPKATAPKPAPKPATVKPAATKTTAKPTAKPATKPTAVKPKAIPAKSKGKK
jgi:DNA-binding protein H-NS